MDCIFNKQIPKSQENHIIIPPASKTFLNGICKKYSEIYQKELEDILTRQQFKEQMILLNENLKTIWPCNCLFYGVGYFCCLCTFGLSFLIPYKCVNDAEEVIKREVKTISKYYLKKKGYKMKLVKCCSTSWLEIYQCKNKYVSINISY